jgi:basic membrane lipoprotein Med (substrate-binding protein (PBP1-ABC) superfamily)
MPPEKQQEIIDNTLKQDVSIITELQGVQTEVVDTQISNLEKKIE